MVAMLNTSARLLRLLALLQTRRHWPGPELAASLEVTVRTLRRDVDRLRQLGYPVAASSGVAGGYAFRAGAALPPLLLEDDEALAAALALRSAATGSIAGIEEPALRALVKLEQVAPPRLRRRVNALRESIQPLARGGPSVDVDRLAGLSSACRDQRRLRFDYADAQGRASRREVDPLGLVHTAERWYLVAWDPSREGWRSFRVDRIGGAPETGGHYPPRPGPEGGDLRAFVARALAGWSPQPDGVPVQIVFDAAALGVETLRRLFPMDGAGFEPLAEGRCRMRAEGGSIDLLLHRLLASGLDFVVESPPALIERLRRAGGRFSRAARGAEGSPPAPAG